MGARLLIGLSLLALLGACAKVERDAMDFSARRIRVVATTNIVADLVGVIGGDRVEVHALMGPGVDPHLFKASARDVARMAEADVIVYNGLHLEGKMTDVFEEMRVRGIPTWAVAERGVPDSLRRESVLFQGNYDPHVWFDVRLWRMVASYTAQQLGLIDSLHADVFAARGEAYQGELASADAYVRDQAQRIPQAKRVIVTSHDAFGYFGRSYEFDVRGLQGISTATEAGTADVQDVARLVAERRIPAMFIESSVSPRGIEAVREAVRSRGFDVEIGGTLYGDALGAPGTPSGTYLGMIRHNIDIIVNALSDAGSH